MLFDVTFSPPPALKWVGTVKLFSESGRAVFVTPPMNTHDEAAQLVVAWILRKLREHEAADQVTQFDARSQ